MVGEAMAERAFEAQTNVNRIRVYPKRKERCEWRRYRY